MADKGKVNAPKANRQKPRCRPRRPASRRRLLAVVSLGRSRNIAHSHPSAAHHRPMAKRPSTQITYPLGLSARFALRSIAIERGISPSPHSPRGRIGDLRRAPTPPFCRPRKPRSDCARSFRGSSSGGRLARTARPSRASSSKTRLGWARPARLSTGYYVIRRSRRAVIAVTTRCLMRRGLNLKQENGVDEASFVEHRTKNCWK